MGDKAGLSLDEVDIFEINEAFASQATMSVEHLKIPMEKVNPKGGAIALGHPLGCTGSRQIATLLPELKRTGKKTWCGVDVHRYWYGRCGRIRECAVIFEAASRCSRFCSINPA